MPSAVARRIAILSLAIRLRPDRAEASSRPAEQHTADLVHPCPVIRFGAAVNLTAALKPTSFDAAVDATCAAKWI